MKKTLITLILTVLSCFSLFSQISPYQLSTEWAFGEGGRMVFTGEFPSSSVGVTSSMGTNTLVGPENSSAIVYTDKTRALYTNTMQMYNNNPLTGGAWTDQIYSQLSNAICAGSCADGGILFPDPAAPNSFYYISGNDLTGGSCQNKGNNRIRFTGYPLATYDAAHGIVSVDIYENVGENITAGADRSGGYWVATHDKGNTNTFKIWHYTSTGISGPIIYDMAQNFTANAIAQSSIQFSPCMDKIAFTGANWVVIYNFNNVTGVIGAPIWESNVGVSSGDGLEFSPDGDRIYWTGNNTGVSWHDITNNTNGSAGSGSDKSWSMQLGNDGNIYTSPDRSTSLGRIDNANSAPTITSVTINGGGSVYRGLTNLAWLAPNVPSLNSTSGADCKTFNFNYIFKNWYGTNITIKPTEATIDYGDGTVVNNPTFPTSHTFPIDGTYTVTYTYKDLYCDQIWTASVQVVVSCPMPVNLLSFEAQVIDNKAVDLNWTTSSEVNHDYYVIERSSDGINYNVISNKIRNNYVTSNRQYMYNTMDLNPLNGVNHYRLVQYDIDGTRTVCAYDVVDLNDNSDDPFITITKNNTVLINNAIDCERIIIVDQLGRIIVDYSAITPLNEIEFKSITNGVYVAHILTKTNKVHNTKFVVYEK